MRRTAIALALALLGCLLVGLPAAVAGAAAPGAASTGIGIRLLEAPADRADDPRARSYVVDHVQPGQLIERNIEISNGTPLPARVELYPGAAWIDGGQFIVGDRSEENEVTSWTTVTPGDAVVSGSATAEATLAIAVPHDAPAGEYYGVVWAAMPSGAAAAGAGMTVTSRVGVRIYLSVGGTEPRTDFVVESLTAVRSDGGHPAIAAQVCNTGGRAVDLLAEVSLQDGPGGTSVGPVPAGQATTLGVGQCGPVKIGLGETLPDGPWEAEVIVRSGRTERQTSATVTFPPPGGSRPAPLADKQNVAWTIFGAVAAATGVLVLGAVALRRCTRSRSQPATSSSQPPAPMGPPSMPVPQPTAPTSTSSPVRLRPPPSHRSGASSLEHASTSITGMRARWGSE